MVLAVLNKRGGGKAHTRSMFRAIYGRAFRAPYTGMHTFFMGAERTATEVHSTLCALVTTQAAASSAWSEYESILLDAETQAFFAARLAQGDSGGDSSQPSKKKKKKRKLRDDDDEAEDEDPAAVAVVCEHCGGAVPEVSLRVACMDGTTLEVTVAQRGLVREVKRLVGQVRSALIAIVSLVAGCLIASPLCSFSRATWTRA
jgi:hypothetical protein